MSGRRPVALGAAALALAALALLLASCATVPVAGPTAGGPATTAAPADTSKRATAIYPPGVQPPKPYVPPRRATAAIDTTPSPAALRVLATIPEPIPAAERVPPPAPTPAPPLTVAGAVGAIFDSAGVADPAASDTSTEIPVPQPTEPLGDRPSSSTSLNPAAGAAVGGAAVGGAAAAGQPAPSPMPMPPPSAAPPDTCWRVQIAAPAEREKAVRIQDVAESLLLARMEIVSEKKLFKVRTSACLDRESADRLKERALASGFEGAFRLAEKGK